jgi:hypothetical protein
MSKKPKSEKTDRLERIEACKREAKDWIEAAKSESKSPVTVGAVEADEVSIAVAYMPGKVYVFGVRWEDAPHLLEDPTQVRGWLDSELAAAAMLGTGGSGIERMEQAAKEQKQ